jgi:hypothetical protein
MQEIWKDISGYEGCYQVSDLGNVRSIRINKEPSKTGLESDKSNSNLTPCKSRGYYVLRLSLNCECTTVSIHRLVCSAFHENPENKRTVNHKNGIKTDNRAVNLEWNTDSENIYHAYRTGLKVAAHKGKFGIDNHLSKKVYRYDLNGIFIDSFNGGFEAMRKTGINNKSISKCCTGKSNSSGGYIWKLY